MKTIRETEKDTAKRLIEFVRQNPDKSLSESFRKFGQESGKSAGSLRNLYYAAAKKATDDENFCRQVLGGVPLKTTAARRFTKEDERELIKRILSEREKSPSVRSAVYRLADGDGKTALRYQNKYRALIRKNRELFREIGENAEWERSENSDGDAWEEQEDHGKKEKSFVYGKHAEEPKAAAAGKTRANFTAEYNFMRVKSEINKMVESISLSVRKENAALKRENAKLKDENERLALLLSTYKSEFAEFFEKGMKKASAETEKETDAPGA